MSVSSRAGDQDHFAFIEGMRGVAALYVVFQHFCSMIDPYHKFVRSTDVLGAVSGAFWYGHLAVSAFIVISGFCLQLSLFRHDPEGGLPSSRVKQFLLRRCRRILPPYYACLCLSLIVWYFVTRHQSGLPWAQYLPVTTENTVAHFLMVHNFDPAWMYKINGVLWSIAIEFQLYFLFPALAWLMVQRKGWIGGFACIASFLLILFFAPATQKLYPWYGSLFVVGMLAARLQATCRTQQIERWCGTVAIAFFGMALYALSATKNIAFADCFFGLCIAAVLALGCWGAARPVTWFFSLRPLLGIGAFSYSLYLVHHPVLQVIFVNKPVWASTPAAQFGYLIAIGLPIILMASFGFYRLFEKPFISPPGFARIRQ